MENKFLEEFNSDFLSNEIKISNNTRVKLEKETKKIGIIGIVLWFPFAWLTGYLLFDYNIVTFSLGVFLIIGYLAGLAYYIHFSYKDFKLDFKNKIMEPLFNTIGFSFNSPEKVTQAEIEDTKMFLNYNLDAFSSGQKVKGIFNNINIEISEILCEEKYKDHKKVIRFRKTFGGIFFKAKFNKNISNHTVVIPNAKKISLPFKEKSLDYNKLENIRLENIEFESIFEVFSDNGIEARYILTPDMMEKMVSFQKKFNKNIYLSFKNGYICIAIEHKKGLFEAPIIVDIETIIKEYIEITKTLLSIVEDLKLDNDIYKK